MTREEAIDMVKYILETMPKEPPTECDYIEEWFYEDNKIRKSLNMAIKALEREPVLEKDGTLVVTTEHYKNVGRVLVQYGTYGSLFYQD